jgi:hypothetical protein
MSSDMQLELAISRDIDDYLNTMLIDMQKMLNAYAKSKQFRLDNAQLSNLMAVAEETSSVEVVKNYIRYQMGRPDSDSSWRHSASDRPTFGDSLIAALDTLKSSALGIVTGNAAKLNEDEQVPYVDRTWIRLTRLYVGYMRRYLYYRNDEVKRERAAEEKQRAAGGR